MKYWFYMKVQDSCKGGHYAQQISESELVLMKIIWKNGGAALYSLIMEELEKTQNE